MNNSSGSCRRGRIGCGLENMLKGGRRGFEGSTQERVRWNMMRLEVELNAKTRIEQFEAITLTKKQTYIVYLNRHYHPFIKLSCAAP